MTGNPTAEEIAGAAFKALQAKARAQYGSNTQQLLVVYAVEAFLRRLSSRAALRAADVISRKPYASNASRVVRRWSGERQAKEEGQDGMARGKRRGRETEEEDGTRMRKAERARCGEGGGGRKGRVERYRASELRLSM